MRNSDSEDRPRKITEASHEVPCSAKFLRKHVHLGNIEAVRLWNSHMVFYNRGIKQARILLYGEPPKPASKKHSKKKNGR